MDPNTPSSPDKDPPPSQTEATGLVKFWQELRRRKVVRVATVYAIAAWLIIQIAVATFPSLYIPPWALSFMIMCVILGFPVALILAWAFELTPEGIRTTKIAQEEKKDTGDTTVHSSTRSVLLYSIWQRSGVYSRGQIYRCPSFRQPQQPGGRPVFHRRNP